MLKKISRRVDRLRTLHGAKNVLALAATGKDGLSVSQDEFDQNPDLLACENGVVDLRNGRLRPARPEDYLTKCTNIPYLESAGKPETFIRTTKEMFPKNLDKMVDFLQTVYGLSLSGHSPDNLFIFPGKDGSNGKTTCQMRPVLAVLGDYAAPVAPEVIVDSGGRGSPGGPAAHLVALRGLRLALVSELEERVPLATAQVKAHTGGDLITAREPYGKKYVTFPPSHTLIIPTNHVPRLAGDDQALGRRLVIVPFKISFVDYPKAPHERPIDRGRPAEIMKELPELLKWLVDGCLKWQAAGRRFELPDLVADFTADIRRDEDAVGAWLAECCVEDPKGRLSARAAYDSFEGWFENNVGRRVPSQKWFGQHLALRAEKKRTQYGVFYLNYRLM